MRACYSELVNVERVGRPRTPVLRIVGEDRHGGDGLAVVLRDEALAARDRLGELATRKRQRPLLEAALADPTRRFVEQTCDGLGVFRTGLPNVHSTTIASPKE